MLLLPLLLAVVQDSVVTAPVVPTSADLLQYAFTLVLGIVTPFLYQLLERNAAFLQALNPTAKRGLVSLIPAAIALTVAWAHGQWAWIPLDPTTASAAAAAAIAFAVHAGDKAIEAKAS